jgi:hypothetical protein
MNDFEFPAITVAKVAFEPYDTFGSRAVKTLVGVQYFSATA